MSKGDAAPREMWRTKGKGKEEGGTGGQAGDGDSTAHVTDQITGDGDGADKARRQRTWVNDGDNWATAPPHAETGAMRRDRGDVMGGRGRRVQRAHITLLPGRRPFGKPRGEVGSKGIFEPAGLDPVGLAGA